MVTVRLTDGSHIDVNFGRDSVAAAYVVPDSGVDSHGNRLPSRWSGIGQDPPGRPYDFSGPGNPLDQHDVEQFVGDFGIKITGQGKHVRCISTGPQTIVCHRNEN